MNAAALESRTDWLIAQIWPKVERPDGWAAWAVLDGARDPRVYDLVRYSRVDRACLFAGEHPEQLLRSAPHLIRLSPGTQYTRDILTAGWGKSWGIVLTTAAPFDKLRAHLRTFLRVRDQRGRRLLFRYYDPRVFRDYLPTCLPLELDTVFGPIESFVVEAREGVSLLRFGCDRHQLVTETVRVPLIAAPAPAPAGTPAAVRR